LQIEVYSPTIKRREMDAVLTAMVEDQIGPGEQAKFLVQTAREKLKFDYCLALRSPAIALFLALKSLNPERGQGVIVSALSPLYYSRVIDDLGLIPLYCDVLSSAAYMGRETVEKAIASKPEGLDIMGIVLHHTLGFLGDGTAISELGIPLIEDCSQSYGTLIGDGSSAQSPGNAGVFTILGLEERDMLTSGGGALLYSANRRAAGRGTSEVPRELPPEYGLPDMNAAMAVVQFREAAKNNLKRRDIARLYTQSALRTRHKRFIQHDIQTLPVEYNNYAFSLILETGLKDVKTYARRKEIAVENAFENTLVGSGLVPPEQCPEAYSLSLRTVLFPLYPRLGTAEAEKVSKLILTLP
jgi:dTDP-4-amino-4,6-dideoxygalactose transaminase